jgi:Zn-dependent protease with chaperone function
VFFKSGVTSVLLLYFLATVIVSIFAGRFRENLNTFILIELGIIALFAIATIAILAVARGIAQRNEYDASKVGSKESKRGGF